MLHLEGVIWNKTADYQLIGSFVFFRYKPSLRAEFATNDKTFACKFVTRINQSNSFSINNLSIKKVRTSKNESEISCARFLNCGIRKHTDTCRYSKNLRVFLISCFSSGFLVKTCRYLKNLQEFIYICGEL